MVAKHRLIDRTRRYTVRCVLLSATLWSLSHAAAGQTVRIDDMLVDVGQLHNTGSATGQRWPDGIVYYAFDASVTRQQKARFEKAVARWESAIQEVAAAMGVASPVTFAAATESESNYILVENDAGSGISGQTHVGAAGPAAQFRISDWSDTFTVEHELGHTLGLIHEHQRSDRDNYIVVHLDRMGADCHRFFEVIPNAINYSSYDLQSLMHYSTTVCARNLLKPTIELRAGSSANVGQRARIRRSDAEDVFHRYAGPLLTATAHGGNLNRYTFVLSFSTRIDPASLSSAFEVVGSQTGVHHYVTYQSTVEWRTTVQVSLNQPVYVGEIITLKVLPVLSDLSGMSQRSPSAVQFEVQDRVATPIGPPTDATISSPVDFVWLAVGAQSVEIQVARDDVFVAPVVSAEFANGINETTNTIELPLGTYWWRVRSDGGSWSQAARFTVVPQSHRIHPLYPNPTLGRTTVQYTLPHSERASLTVFDLLGNRVAAFDLGEGRKGENAFQFDLGHLSSGVYACVLATPDFADTELVVRR